MKKLILVLATCLFLPACVGHQARVENRQDRRADRQERRADRQDARQEPAPTPSPAPKTEQ